jgi:hypothetical protein
MGNQEKDNESLVRRGQMHGRSETLVRKVLGREQVIRTGILTHPDNITSDRHNLIISVFLVGLKAKIL